MGTKMYVSGPMSGLPNYNFPAFEKAASILREKGYDVLSAHEVQHNDNGIPGSISWEDYLRHDLIAMLKHCNSVVVLTGWEKSKGARLEVLVAKALKMPIYFLSGEELFDVHINIDLDAEAVPQ